MSFAQVKLRITQKSFWDEGAGLFKIKRRSLCRQHWDSDKCLNAAFTHSKGSYRPVFLSNVLKHSVTEKGMTLDELVANSYVLIIAGSETTATLLSGVTYYILTVPGVFDKLKAEIRGSFSSEEQITWPAFNQLKYTLAVLNEGPAHVSACSVRFSAYD